MAHSNAELVGNVVDTGSVATGIPVTVATVFYGIPVEQYIMYGTAVLVTVSLIKLVHQSFRWTRRKYKKIFKK